MASTWSTSCLSDASSSSANTSHFLYCAMASLSACITRVPAGARPGGAAAAEAEAEAACGGGGCFTGHATYASLLVVIASKGGLGAAATTGSSTLAGSSHRCHDAAAVEVGSHLRWLAAAAAAGAGAGAAAGVGTAAGLDCGGAGFTGQGR